MLKQKAKDTKSSPETEQDIQKNLKIRRIRPIINHKFELRFDDSWQKPPESLNKWDSKEETLNQTLETTASSSSSKLAPPASRNILSVLNDSSLTSTSSIIATIDPSNPLSKEYLESLSRPEWVLKLIEAEIKSMESVEAAGRVFKKVCDYLAEWGDFLQSPKDISILWQMLRFVLRNYARDMGFGELKIVFRRLEKRIKRLLVLQNEVLAAVEFVLVGVMLPFENIAWFGSRDVTALDESSQLFSAEFLFQLPGLLTDLRIISPGQLTAHQDIFGNYWGSQGAELKEKAQKVDCMIKSSLKGLEILGLFEYHQLEEVKSSSKNAAELKNQPKTTPPLSDQLISALSALYPLISSPEKNQYSDPSNSPADPFLLSLTDRLLRDI